jgi:hypothetical protein
MITRFIDTAVGFLPERPTHDDQYLHRILFVFHGAIFATLLTLV